MKILWLSWKDIEHPLAGGAEVVSSELGKRLAKDGHEVIFVTAHFPGAASQTEIDGYKVIRLSGKLGGRMRIYFDAWRYVRRHLREWPDLTVEEINTMPFFTRFYMKKPRVLFFHQLCREIWFYQLLRPIGLVGYFVEALYLRLLSHESVITVSGSTKQDLMRHGFKDERIMVISEGTQLEPIKSLVTIKKYKRPTLLSLGALRPMKRTLHQLRAFELAKAAIPDLQLKIAGDSNDKYGQKVLQAIDRSAYKDDIEYLGRVDKATKLELMRRCHVILVTSVKEGWGLIVTEAASQGTPAIVYDVDGLRDSVRDGWSGLVTTKNTPYTMSQKVEQLLPDAPFYSKLRENGWAWSKQINFDQSYKDLLAAISQNIENKK